jgi:hypothetical protein
MADHPLERVPEPTRNRRLFKQRSLTPHPTKVINLVRTAASADDDWVILQVKLSLKIVDRCSTRAKKDGTTLNQTLARIITESVKANKK